MQIVRIVVSLDLVLIVRPTDGMSPGYSVASPFCNLEILSGRGRESQVLIVRVWVEESKYGGRAHKNLTMCWKIGVVRQVWAILLF